ncbi:MAG: FGGY family carbohydrate kinase, partial [Eubacteriales bacterium]
AIAVDKNGEVLCNTPIWMDTRAFEICNRVNEKIGADRIFEISGNAFEPMYTTPKILWYKENLPEVYNKTDKILQSNSYIAFRLTNAFSQDKSQGYGLHCFDMKKGMYDEKLCEDLGIDMNMLPKVYNCSDIVGEITAKAALETGLAVGTPVVAGGLDAACGTLGVGVIQDGQTQEQGGQAGGMSICTAEYKAHPKLILSYHVVPDKWLLQGGTVGGGGVMKWFNEQFGENETLQEMDEEAEKISAGSDGLVFLPYMAGERSPIWDKNAKGVFFRLDYSKTKAHMIRSALEGVAYSLHHNLEAAKEAGAMVNEMHAMGGDANSRLWTQIKADVTGKTIKVPSTDTATTMGAAILAGVGTGIYKSFDEAVQLTV